MIYFNFINYDEFKKSFGMRKTNEGEMVRKDKITLNVLKDMFRHKSLNPELWSKFFVLKSVALPSCQNDIAQAGRSVGDGCFPNILCDRAYALRSNEYRVDSEGLCYDGDIKAIRYEHNDHIYKMKASKFFMKIWQESANGKFFGEKAGIYCSEKFAEAWSAYAQSKIEANLYTLHVGDSLEDFERIYTSDKDFGSCMRNSKQYAFYHHAVDASAAWLEDKDGEMVCRCVIFNKCKQKDTGTMFRIAERQYAVGQSDILKNILVSRLYAEGYIDAHKRVGASCSDGWQEICDRNGAFLGNPLFSIECNLECGDTLSYQDTFKHYDIKSCRAFNHDCCCYTHNLDTTDSTFDEDEVYDEWAHDYYRDEELYEAYWWDSYGNLHHGDVAECNIDNYFIRVDRGQYYRDYVHEDDVVRINGEDWCKYDEDIVCIDGEWYEKGYGCEYCEDIDDYAANYIEYEGDYYANYSYSELLNEDIPDSMFGEVEQEYADNNGYVRDYDGEWVKVEELEEVGV